MKRIALSLILFGFAAPVFAADCYVAEYETTLRVPEVPVAVEPRLAMQTVLIGGAAQSSVFNNRTRFLAIKCETKAHFRIGQNPTATTSDFYLAADEVYHVGVSSGQRISFIAGS